MKLKDRVAIITGGGSGLGEAGCRKFAKEGAKVVVADFNLDAAKRVADSIVTEGGQALAVQVDVSDREKVDNMVKTVIDTYGKIDILVNNAGITRDSTLKKMTVDQWNAVINTNLTGVFHCTSAVVNHMLEQGYGRIISTSSIVGTSGNFGQTNYAAAKAGVIGMTKTWAKELAGKEITANAVAPGFIETPMTAAMPPEVLANMAAQVPRKRLGTAEDIARVYLFLAEEESDYINGTVIEVDGGSRIVAMSFCEPRS